jgi:hypothetical protein
VVASKWKQALLWAFLSLPGIFTSSWVGHYYGKQKGIAEGLTTYHKMCYTNGPGFIIIDGAIVLCGPGGKLSEPEKKELDKGVKTWYHKYLKE